jgi:hypothetical protein
MLSNFWPSKLKTPYFELGSSFSEGLKELATLGQVREDMHQHLGREARVDAKQFSVAIYERNHRISAVWYDDPAGRKSQKGIGRKIRLYLKRYTLKGTWRQTLDNGYSLWWLNEQDERLLDYGLHGDVILITDRRKFEPD